MTRSLQLRARIVAAAALCLMLAALAWQPAAAQVPPLPSAGGAGEGAEEGAEAADLSSPEAVRAMVSRLSDEEVRAILLERLDAEAADAKGDAAGAAATELLADAAQGFGGSVLRGFEKLPNLAGGIGEAFARFHAPRGWAGTLELLAIAAMAAAAGYAAFRAVGRIADGNLPAPVAAGGDRTPSAGRVVARLAAGLAINAGQAAAALAAAYAVTLLADPAPPAAGLPDDRLILWFALKQPALYVFAMAAAGRFLFSPDRPALRLVDMGDDTAGFVFRGLVIFAAIAGFRSYALSFLGGHGIDLAEMRLGFWMTLALYGWLFWIVWRARAGLTRMLTGRVGEPTPAERAVARAYPYAVLGLIAIFWVLTESFVGLGRFDLLDGRLPLTLLVLIFAPAADRAIRAIVYRAAPPEEGEGAMAEAAFERTRRSYVRVGRVILTFLVIFLLAKLWRFSFRDMAMAGIGVQLAGRMLEAVFVLGVGYILIEIVRIRINSMLAREKTGEPDAEEPGGGEGGGAGGSRLATVLPLVSGALQVAIGTITVLTALGTLGVDTTPLLAGAGIVGIAIGFGAQTLVADVVSGIFFLIDDAFRTGEYVEVEGTVGTVEAISVRSLRLRHHLGPVHTIPFGQIPKLTNYSRDWVIMKLRFTVPFDTDLMKVKKIFKKIGQEMIADERFADDFLQPFKSQGVLEVDDVGIVIRGKFMAKPGRQWTLRKEIYARVQKAFEENGLQFARKEVRVKIDSDPDKLTDEQKQAVAAAASEAAEKGLAPASGPEPR